MGWRGDIFEYFIRNPFVLYTGWRHKLTLLQFYKKESNKSHLTIILMCSIACQNLMFSNKKILSLFFKEPSFSIRIKLSTLGIGTIWSYHARGLDFPSTGVTLWQISFKIHILAPKLISLFLGCFPTEKWLVMRDLIIHFESGFKKWGSSAVELLQNS